MTMDPFDRATFITRLESLERELLSIASHFEVDDTPLRERTFADLETVFVLNGVYVARLRLVIMELAKTRESL